MARAERRAHGQLPFAAHRAGEDQVGDVRAGDDEHDGRSGEQHEQDRPRRRRDLIAERGDAQPDLSPRRVRSPGVPSSSPRGPRSARRARPRVAPRLQPPEQLRHAVRAPGDHRGPEMMRARHHVGDDLGVGRIGHRRLQHTDDRGRARTEPHAPADDGRIAVERAAPEPVRQDRDRRCVRPVI